jgi:anti-anti-sigma factor
LFDTTATMPLTLSVQHPTTGICLVTVAGELDMLTAPLLQACVGDQLATSPQHLLVDLQPVRFFGLHGLNCLLRARELACRSQGTQLHLAGLTNPVVGRLLKITGTGGLFSTYLVVNDAWAELVMSADSVTVDPPSGLCPEFAHDPPHRVPRPAAGRLSQGGVLEVVWCRSVGSTWTLELREVDPDHAFGALVDWISSRVPVSQPPPDLLVHKLLDTRGLRLCCQSASHPDATSNRHHIGYAFSDT